ncbi:DNA-binding helix-turn-helix protein [Leptospira santarosai str. CBC523]|uniref:helix-turn-helix domain-containing protein n=1 Tax=Leptospira santarosai TaxID=28183 RepID=UPI0002C02BD4|nr:helix-turn-helix domain-containing protein [Leptospira santarosai]EMO15385.1 DNA-binding helix-turn-helix protein [Leptospira santarosai str. CBC523]
MNTFGIESYKNILELGIFYFHAAGVIFGVVSGFSKLFSNNFFNKSYGSVLQSFAFFLILNNGILIDQGNLRNESRITFGFYYGLVLYSCCAVSVCFYFILDSLDNPWIYCKRLLSLIPVIILFSYLLPNLFFIFFIDILGFAISIFTLFWSFRKILKSDKSILFFNLPFLSFLISICFVFDFLGTVFDKKDLFLFAELISGSVICYTIILERFFPSLFCKVSITNTGDEIELKTIPILKEIEKKKYPLRSLLNGIDLNKVEIKLNHFLATKGFKDEELRLPDFAVDLGITTHQASHYLNKYLSMSYADFLNYHRIYEVINLLQTHSNFDLLDIALECGFNSASSFHRACIKFTGKSPRNLRKDIQLNSESLKNVDSQNTKTKLIRIF